MTHPATRTHGAVISDVVADESTLRRLVRQEIERAIKPVLAALAHQDAGQAQELPELLTKQEVAALLRVDVRTLRRMVLAGEVPAPITISDRTDRWRRSTIESSLRKKEKRALTAGRR